MLLSERGHGLACQGIHQNVEGVAGELSQFFSLLGAVLLLLPKGVPLRLQLLFYPGMQAEPLTPSRKLYAEGFLLTEPQIQWMFHSFVEDPSQFADWRFAPIHADTRKMNGHPVQGDGTPGNKWRGNV